MKRHLFTIMLVLNIRTVFSMKENKNSILICETDAVRQSFSDKEEYNQGEPLNEKILTSSIDDTLESLKEKYNNITIVHHNKPDIGVFRIIETNSHDIASDINRTLATQNYKTDQETTTECMNLIEKYMEEAQIKKANSKISANSKKLICRAITNGSLVAVGGTFIMTCLSSYIISLAAGIN